MRSSIRIIPLLLVAGGAALAAEELPRLFINSTEVKGSLLKHEGRWYVAVDDLAKALDGKTAEKDGRVTLTTSAVRDSSGWVRVGAMPAPPKASANPAQAPRKTASRTMVMEDVKYTLLASGTFAEITGLVTNLEQRELKAVKIAIKLYNARGDVVDTPAAYIDTIDPRGRATFRAFVTHPEDVARYEVFEPVEQLAATP